MEETRKSYTRSSKTGLGGLIPAIFASSSLGLCGLDALTYEIHGDLINFSKVGFNNKPINPVEGLYPTGTFVELTGKLETTMHLGKGWSISVGGALGGMPYDSTRYDRYSKSLMQDAAHTYIPGTNTTYLQSWQNHQHDCNGAWGCGSILNGNQYVNQGVGGGIADPRGIGYMFMGEWNGLFPNYYPAYAYSPGQSRPYEVYKANVQYKSDKVWMILGRYDTTQVEDIDWFYQLTQGFYGLFKLHSKVKLQVFSSWGRGIADGQWMFPIYREKPWGEHKIGLIYQVNKHFSIHPHVWFSPQVFTAPEIKLYYDTNPDFDGRGFRAQTTFYGMYVYQWKNDYVPGIGHVGRFGLARYNTWDTWNLYNGVSNTINPAAGGNPNAPWCGNRGSNPWCGLQGPGGATLLFKQRFDINNYNTSFGIYWNIGNPNPNIGTYGNPVAIDGVEQWTGSIYGLGFASINNITAADAVTVYWKGGGVYGRFDWELAERYTNSPRAKAQALALYMNYQFGKHVKAGIKLEWFLATINPGYNPGVGFLSKYGQPFNMNTGLFSPNNFAQNYGNVGGMTHAVTQDRSHLMTHISYSF
ncbi:outer membrane family protein [Helicobacter cynogastricus]|uniref:OMP8 n=1 Tax=Helicobacter cynogastricus TaxID=329937 RepID=A0A1R3UCQ1_9HELI|nr:outer membrane family protein [Helicobacter cynogastricus]SFZ72044.1 OMP8 [Helicobacter cynogastricus]